MSVRILALVVDAFGGTGGISQYNRDLISAWSALGMVKQVEVLPRFAPPANLSVPEKVVQRPPAGSAFLYSLRAISHALRQDRFDLVFCGHLHMMPLAVIVSKLSGAPIWLQVHGIEAWSKPSDFVRWCSERAMLVTAVSRHTRRQFLRWASIDPNWVLVLPNTVGEQFVPDEDRISAKKKYGLTGKRVLLTVSRLAKSERYKGHDKIIRNLPQILEKVGNLIYVIAGDGDMKCELEKLVRQEKLEEFVTFTGQIENSELPTMYRAADIFVMPSSGEGFGIVFLEALACGTPVIAGNSDGAGDPLQDGNLGVLSDAQELPAEIQRMLDAPRCIRACRTSDRERERSVRRFFGRAVFDDLVKKTTERLELAPAQTHD